MIGDGPARDVIVVDDRDDDRRLLAMVLEHAGHAVRSAASGPQALALACERPPDLIVTDVLMPGMDGFELARRVREEQSLASVRLAFYTAESLDGEARELAARCGVAHFVPKPGDPPAMMAAIAAALDDAPAIAQPGRRPIQISGRT